MNLTTDRSPFPNVSLVNAENEAELYPAIAGRITSFHRRYRQTSRLFLPERVTVCRLVPLHESEFHRDAREEIAIR
jgi:hypothetical protein